jgi:hypothetical protein
MFVADEADARLLLNAATEENSLAFALSGLFDTNDVQIFSRENLRNVGVAPSGDVNQEPTYLAAEEGALFTARAVLQRSGGTKYAVDQTTNGDTVAITFGGRHSREVLIAGRVGTVSATNAAVDLYKSFERLIKKHFTKVKSFYVGPEALAALYRGERLTTSVRSPKLYDLQS